MTTAENVISDAFLENIINDEQHDYSFMQADEPVISLVSFSDVGPNTFNAIVNHIQTPIETNHPDELDECDSIVDDEIIAENQSTLVWDQTELNQTTVTENKPLSIIEEDDEVDDEVPEIHNQSSDDIYMLNDSSNMSDLDASDSEDILGDNILGDLSRRTINLDDTYSEKDTLKKLQEENRRLRTQTKQELSSKLSDFMAIMQIGTNTRGEKIAFITKCSKTYSSEIHLDASDFDGCDMSTLDQIYKKLRKLQADHQNKFYILFGIKIIFIGISKLLGFLGFDKIANAISTMDYSGFFGQIDEECNELQTYITSTLMPNTISNSVPIRLTFKIVMHFVMNVVQMAFAF